jgi:hypothetical protein
VTREVILVLCDDGDASAMWATGALRRRGLSPTVLTGRDLAAMRGWRHTVAPDGTAACTLRLAGGESLSSMEVGAVLNRLSFVPWAWLRQIGGQDRDYAAQEMQAFYLSWLHALPEPMLNRPTPQGLCGNMRHPSAWTALAANVGLPVRAFRQRCEDDPVDAWQAGYDPLCRTVVVVGPHVIGPDALVQRYRTKCLRLTRNAGCALLGIDFTQFPDGEWGVTRASPLPELTRGGEALADALAETLGHAA